MKEPRTISIAKESESSSTPPRLQAHWSQQVTTTAVLFLHGYKGYAAWGCWDQMCDALTDLRIHAFRLDFSGNGTTAERPNEIHDLDAWSDNTYRQELSEAIDAIKALRHQGFDVILMGHSRGGGIATLAAGALRDTMYAVKGLVLLASVSDFERRFPTGEGLANWRATGRWEVKNGRTGETYHHKFHFYEDFVAYRELLDIRRQAARVGVPVLIAHAKDDQAVSAEESLELAMIMRQGTRVAVVEFETGGHTFGTKEPWPARVPLPKEMADLLSEIGHFIQSIA